MVSKINAFVVMVAMGGALACSDGGGGEPVVATKQALSLTLPTVFDVGIQEGAGNGGFSDSCSARGDAGALNGISCLMHFNFPLVNNAVVTSAWLDVRVTNASPQSYDIWAVSTTWDEVEATWYERFFGESWELSGAKGTSERGALVNSFVVSSTGDHAIFFQADGRSAIQGWLRNQGTHQGIIIASQTNSDGISIASREATTVEHRPTLVINYQIGCGAGGTGTGGTGGIGGTGTGGTGGC